jgi:hypothetical protein
MGKVFHKRLKMVKTPTVFGAAPQRKELEKFSQNLFSGCPLLVGVRYAKSLTRWRRRQVRLGVSKRTIQRRESGAMTITISPIHRRMIEHDMQVGELLQLLDELGIADDTIIMHSTDNGPHHNTWSRATN